MNSSNLENLRHTLAHLLAAAVTDLWPDTKRTIGPAIENGFYFDFEFSSPITDADLAKIENKMRELLPSWTSMEKHLLTESEAKKEYPNNPYKHELIDEFSKSGEKLSFYKSGNYWDLCKGGHVENPAKEIDSNGFKLTRLAGAYWRGSEKNKMLTRIYGVAFAYKKELDAYLKMQEEAKKRDHKKLGPELDLFTFSELVGPGLPLFTPKGTILRDKLDNFVWELRKAHGYERVDIPHISKKELYEKSGHWEKYKNDLFKIKTREGHDFAMKPMNCPHHAQIYARKQWSYRELPQRYTSTTKVYRDEQSGELAGISRVISITQDDAHVFCRYSQIKEEILKIWNIVETFYKVFNFDLQMTLSLHNPQEREKYLGSPEIWKEAENTLREIAKEKNARPTEAIGEAAFYGPKVDFIAKDSLGREWQVATIQLDMNQPERFDLSCINEGGKAERIVMIHAAIMGSIERFLSVIIEHFAGAFPVWLAPVQVRIIPISEKFKMYAESISHKLILKNVRAELSQSDETLGKRIREAELQKIPYMLIVGEKEMKDMTVNVRRFGLGDQGAMSTEDFLEKIEKEIVEKTL